MANIYTITAVFLPFFLFFLCYIWISSDWIYIQNIQMFVPLFPAIIYTSNITQCYHLHIKYYSMPSSTHQILLNAIIRHNRETLINFEPNSVDIFHKKLYINKYYFLAVYRLAVWYTACTFIGSRYTYQQHNCILHAHSLNTCSILIHMVVFVL